MQLQQLLFIRVIQYQPVQAFTERSTFKDQFNPRKKRRDCQEKRYPL